MRKKGGAWNSLRQVTTPEYLSGVTRLKVLSQVSQDLKREKLSMEDRNGKETSKARRSQGEKERSRFWVII